MKTRIHLYQFILYRCIVIATLLFFVSSFSLAQLDCQLEQNIPINSFTSNDYQLDVSGLINNQLGQNGQGICLVELLFNHNRINQLSIDLISPSGDVINLIGPANVQPITVNSASQWDIKFVPSSILASPDLGFSGQWNNNQPWASFTNYSGIYYPFQFNLEDLTGPANGSWTIRVTEVSEFGVGLIEQINIVFCDDSGLSCNSCVASIGEYETSTFTSCEFDTINTNVLLELNNTLIDNELDTIIHILNNSVSNELIFIDPNSFNPIAGQYQICGLTLNKSTLDSINVMSFQELIDELDQNSICYSISEPCISLNIIETNTVIDTSIFACNEDSVFFNNSWIEFNVDTSIFSSHNVACDTLFNLIMIPNNIEAILDSESEFITCGEMIFLDGSQSIGNNLNYSWNTDNGEYTIDQGNIAQINSAGTYTLIIENESCLDSSVVTIEEVLPQVNIISSNIDCTEDSIQIILDIASPFNSIVWEGPQFIDGQFPFVSTPGEYVVEIDFTAESCPSFKDTIIIEKTTDSINPSFAFNPITNCESQASIQILNDNQNWMYSWIYNDDLISDQSSLMDNLNDGFYHLQIVDNLGCEYDTMFNITIDTISPEAIIEADIDSCNTNTSSLNASSSLSNNGLIYQWSLNNNVISETSTILLSESGLYELSVIDSISACSDTNVFNYLNNNNALNPIIETSNSTCFGSNDGHITELQTQQDASQFEYILDGTIVDFDSLLLYNLDIGLHNLSIVNDSNCIWDTTFVILDPPPVVLSLPSDTMVTLGSSLNISANYLLDLDTIHSIQWYNNGLLFNSIDTDIQLSNIQDSIIIVVEIETGYSCLLSDTMNISIDLLEVEISEIFIPNVFSLSNEDKITIYIPEDINEVKFEVYDRWGSRMHSQSNIMNRNSFDFNVLDYNLTLGVYVYTLEYLDSTNHKQFKTGSITILD